MKKIFALLMTALLLVGFTVSAMADGSVSYEGGAEKFVFPEGGKWTDDDCFINFKDVLPGDNLEEFVTVKNNFKNVEKVRIYMRAIVHDEAGNPLSTEVAKYENVASMIDFLSQLSMKVYNGDKLIYEASPDELGGLQSNVLLGTFYYGEGAKLRIILDVPKDLDNKYANRVGEVDWVFVAEEIPAPVGPDTGDNSNLILYGVLFVAAAAAVVMSLSKKKNHG